MAEMGVASIVDLARSADLFRGFSPSEVDSLLYRFGGVKKAVAKGETVALAGLEAKRLFVVVSGRLRVTWPPHFARHVGRAPDDGDGRTGDGEILVERVEDPRPRVLLGLAQDDGDERADD